ncbi:BaiN/RdsA family NAD(P)/FAD-dependent oxidoreductase [Hydrogenimonas cancrithermarum]|uniref:Aminoacetone oxidase family FAD-binding enzyme n=1 Tax=Hydrogenimonas cancrithermarum TaxID=2993563 RepID=A0ABM8FIL6_9BACT|nr:NAD(P)/FAD-dependent oxidoreductase [Hydrogenimonas cancrithermarum]BDY12126.1 aminoacetone oxidase family FAD-binding enzyme [Hydrogenimonas cancrithermarum]
MRVAIVGGGAAGLMAAVTAAEAGTSVDLYEQNRDVGKKILASGNGRCNISNTSLSSKDYFGKHPSFVDFALKQFDFGAFERFCESIGLPLDIKPDGRVYPLSNEARSVQLALRRYAAHLGVNMLTQRTVTSVERISGKFLIFSDIGKEEYDRVLVCTGSPAAPQLGGSMSGWQIAESFGHTIVPAYPSLVGLHLSGKWHERMSGVKRDAEVTLYVDGKREVAVGGDLLFTRYGISGFAVLDISSFASPALLQGHRVSVGLNLLPAFDRQRLISYLQRLAKRVPFLTLEALLESVLPHKTAAALLASLKLEGRMPAADAGAKCIRSIATRILDWRFDVTETHGYRHAEVAGGGVDTAEVDPKTMASKRVPGLYFAGEVLDIVGKRGGYNLHFAWASGYLAGRGVMR